MQAHRPPQAHERLLQQRQRTRLVAGVGKQPLDQVRLEHDVAAPCRLRDRLGERVAGEGRHVDLASLDERPQRALHQLAVEVGADRQHDRDVVEPVERGKRGDEPRLLVGVGLREELLELVDHEQQPAGSRPEVIAWRAAPRTASGEVASARSAPSASPSADIGDPPGRSVRTDQWPGRALSRSANTPASSSDDLPQPDGPTRHSIRCDARRVP